MANILKLVFFTVSIVTIWSLSVSNGFAQTNDKPFNETVDIVKSYKAKLAEANKMDVSPINEKLEAQKPIFNFTIVPKVMNPPANNVKIPPVSLIQNKTIKLDHFFLKAGAGNYSNLYGDFWYNTTLRKKDMLAANINYNSGMSTPSNSNFSEQTVQVNATKFFKKNILSGKIYLHNNNIHYYGYNHDTIEYDKDSIKQNYLDVGLKFNFSNDLFQKEKEKSKNNKVKYDIGGDLYNLSDAFSANEFCINLHGKFEQNQQSGPVSIEIGNTFYNNTFNSSSNARNIFTVKALYLLKKPLWNVQIGFKAASEIDSIRNKFHFYPNVIFEASVIESSLIAFGGITGNLDNLSYKIITNENPYVRSALDIRNTNKQFELLAGLKGNIANHVNFVAKFSFENLKDLNFFVNDSTDKDAKKFKIVYDSNSTQLVNVHLETTIDINPEFNIILSGNYYQYTTEKLEFPWQKPNYDATLSGRYNLQNKIVFNIDFFLIGKRYAKYYKKAVIMDEIFDLNAGITYNFSPTIGVFFNFNNILSDKYSYWYNYELRGFNFMGGVKANF